MNDVPSLKNILSVSEDNSSSNDDKAAKGINVASRNLSEAAFLYLQSMQTLVLLFIVLTIVNFPVMYIYQSNTEHNRMTNV